MSRYLSQLARETRSKLQPPSRFGWAPKAVAFEEIHEERLVSGVPESPRPAAVVRAEQPAPQVVSAERAAVAAPSVPATEARQSVAEGPRPLEAAIVRQQVEREEPRRPQLPPQTADPVVEIQTVAFLEEDGLAGVSASMPTVPNAPPFAAPQPPEIREITRVLRAAPQPVVDVTIGKIEVIVEGERQAPPLQISRRPEPRVPPKRVDAPRRAGRLARLYQDR